MARIRIRKKSIGLKSDSEPVFLAEPDTIEFFLIQLLLRSVQFNVVLDGYLLYLYLFVGLFMWFTVKYLGMLYILALKSVVRIREKISGSGLIFELTKNEIFKNIM